MSAPDQMQIILDWYGWLPKPVRERMSLYHLDTLFKRLRAIDAALQLPEGENEIIERLRSALEWALDNAGTEHPHYPERDEVGGWHYPYLVNGSPMGGGVGHANFPTALKAVEAARAALKTPEADNAK